jgi:hypothetical protein
MTFAEQLAAARAARPYRDVTVVLDGELTQELEELRAKLGSASTDSRLGVKSEAEVIQDSIDALAASASDAVTIRITRLPGRDWSVLTSKCPVRPDVPIDTHYGYNYDAVCEAAARYRSPSSGSTYAHRIEDGEPVEIADDEWSDLFDVLPGSEIAKIRDAVWELNEYEPQERLNALVKGSGAASRSVSK